MCTEQTDDTVPRIRIRPAEGAEEQHEGISGYGGMSMDDLRRNYAAILKARAVFYPVAYQFLREFGQGRQGTVFLGLRQGARGCLTEHAIKVYDPGLYRSASEYWTDMGRIASQISRLQRVQSPNIVSRHSYEETHGIGYVQMDAVNGTDLQRFLSWDHLQLAKSNSSRTEWKRFTSAIFRIEGGHVSLQPGVTIYMLRHLLRGLERLHEEHFLHSDVKPANMMIDRLGNVKIIDFGRAVVEGEELSFLLGSPMYMAPEMHRREVGDARADLYSVGLVALEMLRGQALAPTDTPEDELLDIKMSLAEQLPTILPAHVLANEGLVEILRRLVDPNPDGRFPNAADAEAGQNGLAMIDKQLVQADLDSEYARDLSDYLAKLVDARTQRVETPKTKILNRS